MSTSEQSLPAYLLLDPMIEQDFIERYDNMILCRGDASSVQEEYQEARDAKIYEFYLKTCNNISHIAKRLTIDFINKHAVYITPDEERFIHRWIPSQNETKLIKFEEFIQIAPEILRVARINNNSESIQVEIYHKIQEFFNCRHPKDPQLAIDLAKQQQKAHIFEFSPSAEVSFINFRL